MRLCDGLTLSRVASEDFDIHQDRLRFVSVILGFLQMNRLQLGFDQTILPTDGEQYIEIIRGER